jgi:hypothetical protein
VKREILVPSLPPNCIELRHPDLANEPHAKPFIQSTQDLCTRFKGKTNVSAAKQSKAEDILVQTRQQSSQ